ncbi:MAG: trypsin-like peptidase domain-containing protein, partial [Pirellulales bacterium]
PPPPRPPEPSDPPSVAVRPPEPDDPKLAALVRPPRAPEPSDAEVKRITRPPQAPEPAPIYDVLVSDGPHDVRDLRLMEEHVRQLAKELVPATVGLAVGQGQGSGVIISPDGFVLTAGHVSGDANREVAVILHDGKLVKGKTLGANRAIDSGLVQIIDNNPEGGEWPYVELGLSQNVRPGQWCLSTGHPGGYQRGRAPVLRFGRVLNCSSDVVTTDCTLVGGDSGGPLFDLEGRVIGIHSRIGGSLSANFHVPANTYRDTWDRLAKAEIWGGSIVGTPRGDRPYIGMLGDASGGVCKITEVLPESPAAKAGVRVGDVVKSFAGEPIANFNQLRDLVRRKKPGEKVKVELVRDQQPLTLEMEIGKRPR